MKNRLKLAAAAFAAAFALSGTAAFAQSTETAEPEPTLKNEIVIEDNRTLTTKGNAELMDNVTDNENLQFITVTARDGNVFYIIIDKGSTSENVYFLNTVDESDLTALVEDYAPEQTTAKQQPEPSSAPDAEPAEAEQTKQSEQDAKKSNSSFMFLIILVLIGGAGLAVYYFKIFRPKKKLEQADDIEDFEIEETESEEVLDEENLDNIQNE